MSRANLMRVTVAVVATLAMVGCSAGAEQPGESVDFTAQPEGALRTMGFNPSDEVGSSRADLAQKALDGVEISMDTADFDPQKFAALAAAGDLPDVVQMDRSSVATFAQKGLILPLDECFAARDVDPDEYWYTAVVAEASWDGSVYAAPQFFQPGLVIINKRVAAAAGVDPAAIDTSDPARLLESAKAMSKLSGAQPTTLGFDPDMPGSITTWISVFGGQVMDEQGKPTLDKSENVEALSFMLELMDAQGGYTEVKSFKDTWDMFGDKNQFVADQVGAATHAQWYINVLSNTRDGVELDAQPIRDLAGNAFAMAGGTALAIPTGAKNPAAACTWLTEVTSLEAWKAAGDARAATVKETGSLNTGLFTGSPEADKAVREAHVVETGDAGFDALIATSYDVLADTRTVGSSPVGKQINDVLNNATGAALTKEKTPQEALAQAQKTAMRDWEALNR